MREVFFPNGYYQTPSDKKISSLYKFQLLKNLFFYWKILKITLSAAKIASRGKYDNEQWAISSRRIIEYAEDCGAVVSIKGLDNISNVHGPVVFIGNHMSVFETYALACMIIPQKQPAFIIKKELLDYPIFGKVMKSVANIAVSRKNPKEDFKEVMEQGSELISKGFSPVVFPQATRMREFVPERFNTIGIKLARKAGVPVIPFALKTDFWGTGKILKDFGPIGKFGNKIFFEFAQAIHVSGSGREEHEKIIAYIKSKLSEWG